MRMELRGLEKISTGAFASLLVKIKRDEFFRGTEGETYFGRPLSSREYGLLLLAGIKSFLSLLPCLAPLLVQLPSSQTRLARAVNF